MICKCVASMSGVMLLSELHPLGWKMFNPLQQAMEWFDLITAEEIQNITSSGGLSYVSAIELIETKSRSRGLNLVLRDWAHLDYVGYPFISTPSFRPLLYDALKEKFHILRISTARHPVTQWQSLSRLQVMQDSIGRGLFGPKQFLAGYKKYAALCLETGFVRYEDFAREPEHEVKKICEALMLEYDAGFKEKWPKYSKITGQVQSTSAENKIELPKSRPLKQSERAVFESNAEYRDICDILGYDHTQYL